jgi:hypothetical protein
MVICLSHRRPPDLLLKGLWFFGPWRPPELERKSDRNCAPAFPNAAQSIAPVPLAPGQAIETAAPLQLAQVEPASSPLRRLHRPCHSSDEDLSIGNK